MLRESKIWDKYQKWLGGIEKINECIIALEEEKKSINDQINDNIEETPEGTVDLHTRLHSIGREIESAEVIKAEFKNKKPFTQVEFVSEFNEHINRLGEKLKDPLEKATKARADLREALSEYYKVHQKYEAEYSIEKSRWESLYRDIDNNHNNCFDVFRRLGSQEYLKSSLFEEFKRGPVTCGNGTKYEIYGE